METTIGSDQPYVTLNNGIKMPQIGLGTFASSEGDTTQLVISAIMDHGYRHIDTAKIYENEKEIGDALQECFKRGIKREDLFIVSKLWHDSDKGDVEGALRKQLASLQLEYLDLYLIHWMIPSLDWTLEDPIGKFPLHKVWAQLEHCVEIGLVKSLGVSNCTTPVLIDILAFCKIKPVTNQIELHPYLTQKGFVNFQKEKLGIYSTAYAPLGAFSWPHKREEHKSLNLLNEQVIKDLAAKYNKPIGQIILNWHLQRGHIIIPKTAKIERLRENFLCYDFTMTEEDHASIDALNQNARFYDPVIQSAFGWNNLPYFDQ